MQNYVRKLGWQFDLAALSSFLIRGKFKRWWWWRSESGGGGGAAAERKLESATVDSDRLKILHSRPNLLLFKICFVHNAFWISLERRRSASKPCFPSGMSCFHSISSQIKQESEGNLGNDRMEFQEALISYFWWGSRSCLSSHESFNVLTIVLPWNIWKIMVSFKCSYLEKVKYYWHLYLKVLLFLRKVIHINTRLPKL